MAWEAEPIKHLLDVTHIRDNGRDFIDSQEYTPGKDSINFISIFLSVNDAELRVKPYTLEHLKQLVEEGYEKGVVNELFVGIRNGTGIVYVGKFWTGKQSNDKRINQYFFKNDEPSGHNFGHMSGPGWPLNQPPVLDERLVRYFNALKEIRPSAIESLERCMKHLTRAGPEYTGISDGGISFKLAKR